MQPSKALTQEVLNSGLNPDPEYEEEWHILISGSKEPYVLSKIQARILQEAIASGSRGIVMFQTFSISIPYIKEFYRKGRPFLKNAKQLPAKATEKPYKPIDSKKWEEFKKSAYQKIGRKLKEDNPASTKEGGGNG